MRIAWTGLALVALAGSPAWADKRLDQAVAKADAQLAKGNEAEAVKILQKAVSQFPRDPEPPLALMRLFTRLGRRDEADAALAVAGERAGGAPPAVRGRIRVLQSALALREGSAGDALTFAREAVGASAGAESLAALARAEARLGLGTARATAERALIAAPASPAALVASGDALLAARLDAQAETAYRRAVELDPRLVAAGAGLTRALAVRGQAAAALQAARAAAQADPQAADAQAALALATLAQDPGDTKGEAVVLAQQASFLEPKNPLPKLALGQVFESRGQLEQARAAFGDAAALDPSWPAPRIAAQGVRLLQGDADGALAALRALPDEFRATGEAELLLGRLLGHKEQWTSAGAAFDRAAALLPGLAEVQALRGEAAYHAGDLATAADAYGRAVRLDPGNLAYRTSHALHLGYDGRREEAVAALLEVTAKPEGQTGEAWMALGGIYRGFEPPRVAEAVAAYEKALKADPRNGQAALGVARSYRAGRQWARAIAAYERLSTAFPRLDREGLLGTAWCYQLSGDDTRARFYTGLALRAGADVEPLRRALSGGGATADDFERAERAEGLRSKDAGEQARAVKGLLELGRPAVPTLAAALGRPGTSLAARELIVDGLSALGPAAREALPQLDRLAGTAPAAPGPPASDEEKAQLEREARLAAKARAASDKIRGRRTDAP
jgi:Flp pilus assembly protein TadD